jgi:hypothetical protein
MILYYVRLRADACEHSNRLQPDVGVPRRGRRTQRGFC